MDLWGVVVLSHAKGVIAAEQARLIGEARSIAKYAMDDEPHPEQARMAFEVARGLALLDILDRDGRVS